MRSPHTCRTRTGSRAGLAGLVVTMALFWPNQPALTETGDCPGSTSPAAGQRLSFRQVPSGTLALDDDTNGKPPAKVEVKSSEKGKTAKLTAQSSCLDFSWETTGSDAEGSPYNSNWTDNMRAVVKQTGQLLKHEATLDVVDVGRSAGYSPGLLLLTPDIWVRNEVTDFKSVSSLLDGAIKFTIRAAHSSYDASDAILMNGDEKKDVRDLGPGAERFVGLPQVDGAAQMQRVDVRIFELGQFRTSTFAYQGEVDWGFEALHLAKKDPFASENTRTRAFGGNIGVGPLGIILTQSVIDTLVGVNVPDKRKQEALTTLDVADLHRRVGSPLAGSWWVLAPASIWASVSRESTDLRQSEVGPPDLSSGYALGASWAWATGSAGVSYWGLFSDVRRTGLEEYDWAGQGLDGYLTTFGSSWTTAYSFFYQDSTNFQPDLADSETAYNHSFTWSYKPQGELGLSTGLGLGFFEGDYGGYEYNSSYWSTTAGVDFTELIRPREGGNKEPQRIVRNATALKAFYTLRGWGENDGDPAARPPALEHFIGFVFMTDL